MDNQILSRLDKAEELEILYHRSPKQFHIWLDEALDKHPGSETLAVWNARLNYNGNTIASENHKHLKFVIFISLLTGLIVKMPVFLPINSDWYYPRFIPFIIFTSLILYFVKNNASFSRINITILSCLTVCLITLILLPDRTSASIKMSLIHMPLLLISILGLSYMQKSWMSVEARLNYIRYLGETIIYASILLLGGIILTFLTAGLFDLIGISIWSWYINYIVVLGLVASPIVATYLYDGILNRNSKIAAIISNIFSPLFLITVSAYLLAMIFEKKSPFMDRDFLITFNGLLLLVWGMTVFSISEINQTYKYNYKKIVNILLIIITLVINILALSAIIFRWFEFGITPNRVAVTGANIIIFVHLCMILRELIISFKTSGNSKGIQTVITNYLPTYTIWSLLIVFVLPITFDFK